MMVHKCFFDPGSWIPGGERRGNGDSLSVKLGLFQESTQQIDSSFDVLERQSVG